MPDIFQYRRKGSCTSLADRHREYLRRLVRRDPLKILLRELRWRIPTSAKHNNPGERRGWRNIVVLGDEPGDK